MANNPLHPDQVTAEWINSALNEGGFIKNSSVIDIKTEILGDSKGFLSSIVKVIIIYDKKEVSAPDSLVVKIEPESGPFREYGNELHAFQREILFYKEVAGNVPIRLPVIYFTVDEPPAFSIVMEDLSHYEPGDQVVGMNLNQIRTTVENVGKLQAEYWNNGALGKLNWMPSTNNIAFDYAIKWDSFVKHFGQFTDQKGLKVGEKLKNSVKWLENEVSKRPKTIVHSDLREDNLLFGSGGADEEVLILDWQLAIRSMGAFDVARLIGGSELPSERKGHQFEVLRCWYDTLIDCGVEAYSWEEAQYDFRLGALYCLCYPVHFHDGVIDAKGRKMELVEVLINRQFASAVELDAESILP